MGDRLRADKPPEYFTNFHKLSLNGTGNEYQPMPNDAMRLGRWLIILVDTHVDGG